MSELLKTALELHQTGQLDSAARLYKKILDHEKENFETLHLLGIVHHQQGDYALAVELIGRAVALRPNAAVYHVNLAESYRVRGDFKRAAGCCQIALRLLPRSFEAFCILGLALQELGRHAEAVDSFRSAIQLRPDYADAHNDLGVSLRELGKIDEALTHFQRAVELEPEFLAIQMSDAEQRLIQPSALNPDPQPPTSLTNLDPMPADSGKPEENLAYYLEAVRLQPDLDTLHRKLGDVLRGLGRLVEARSAYLEAIRLNPNSGTAYLLVGLVLQQEGEWDDALFWLQQAVELNPENTTFWWYLARLFMDRGQPKEAIHCWERALALDPDQAALHIELGWSLQEEGRLDEAREHYLTALRLQPDSTKARVHLGDLHREFGNLAEAEAAYREVLQSKDVPQSQSDYAWALARLATMSRGRLPDADLAALEAKLADSQVNNYLRARLLFALAEVLDARGEYARAADCLQRANAIALEMSPFRKRGLAVVVRESFHSGLQRFFDRDFFARISGMGSQTRCPVFVFGLPRSGTTLIEQVLASHSRVFGAGELRLAGQTFNAIPAMLDRSDSPLQCLPDLDGAAIRRVAEQYLDSLLAFCNKPADRIVDKMPDNYLYLGLLSALFPRATFIHCRRDFRDVAVSCWMTDLYQIPWTNSQEHIAAKFRLYRQLMEHWRAVLPISIHEVDYEETVADLESVARRVLDACGLDWEPACLKFHQTSRTVRTSSLLQVRQPLYRQSVGRWKNYEHALAELFAALDCA